MVEVKECPVLPLPYMEMVSLNLFVSERKNNQTVQSIIPYR